MLVPYQAAESGRASICIRRACAPQWQRQRQSAVPAALNHGMHPYMALLPTWVRAMAAQRPMRTREMAMAAAGSTHHPALAGQKRSAVAASMAARFVSHSRGAAPAGQASGCQVSGALSSGSCAAGRARTLEALCWRNATLAAAPPASRMSSTAERTSGGIWPACGGSALMSSSLWPVHRTRCKTNASAGPLCSVVCGCDGQLLCNWRAHLLPSRCTEKRQPVETPPGKPGPGQRHRPAG